VFRNVGIYNSDAGELPKRKHNIFRKRRKFEITNNSVSPCKIVHCFQADRFLAADGSLVKIHEYMTQNEAKLGICFLASSGENHPFQCPQITSKGNENYVSTNVSPVAEGPKWVRPLPPCQAAQHTCMQQHYAVH